MENKVERIKTKGEVFLPGIISLVFAILGGIIGEGTLTTFSIIFGSIALISVIICYFFNAVYIDKEGVQLGKVNKPILRYSEIRNFSPSVEDPIVYISYNDENESEQKEKVEFKKIEDMNKFLGLYNKFNSKDEV